MMRFLYIRVALSMNLAGFEVQRFGDQRRYLHRSLVSRRSMTGMCSGGSRRRLMKYCSWLCSRRVPNPPCTAPHSPTWPNHHQITTHHARHRSTRYELGHTWSTHAFTKTMTWTLSTTERPTQEDVSRLFSSSRRVCTLCTLHTSQSW